MASCARCGRPTTMRLVEPHDQAHLCRWCIDRQAPGLRLGTLATSLTSASLPPAVTKCPHCGWSADDAIQKGLVGCPLCYEAFDPEIWTQFGIEG